MTPDTEKLKALAEGATAGEWQSKENDGDSLFTIGIADGDTDDRGRSVFSFEEVCTISDTDKAEENLAYLLAANPATVLALIAEIDQLQSELTALKAQVDGAFNEGVEAVEKKLRAAYEETKNPWWWNFANGLDKLKRYTEQNCPGHVASEGNPKVCGRCGIHIEELRPTKPTEAKDGSK